MIIIESNNTIDAFKKGQEMLNALPDAADLELIKESPLVVTFKCLDNDRSIPTYNGSTFTVTFDYSLPHISHSLVLQEYSHYEKLLSPKISHLLTYLKENPFSKRAIINVWDVNQMNLHNKAECLIYILFRKTTKGLAMNVHMRANDAKSKVLLNFHIFAAVHKYVALELNERMDEYNHTADSYHIYK